MNNTKQLSDSLLATWSEAPNGHTHTAMTEERPMADNENYCADCGGDIDSEGDSLEENECEWSHPSDCETCGHPYCDQSC